MNKLRRRAGGRGRELVHAAEVLVVGVLAPLLHHRLVGDVTDMFEYQQAAHQAYWLAGAAVLVTVQWTEGFLKTVPLYLVGQAEEGVAVVEHVAQRGEQ